MSTGTASGSDRLPPFGSRFALACCLGFLLLGVAYTWPLAAHLTDALPFAAVPPEGREQATLIQGDYLQFYYYLWLVRDRVLAGASFLRDPYQFAVDGPRPNLPNTFLPMALPYLALSALGPPLGYNLLVLLSFPFAGLATALLAHRYGLPRSAAVVGGTVFACAPYRVGALLGGHPAGLTYGLVPLALWGLEGALRGSLTGGAWCALALVSLAIMEPHFFYFAALGLPLYLVARLGLAGWHREMLRPGAPTVGAALAVSGAGAWGTMAALAARGWQPPTSVRAAVGAVSAVAILLAWQCLAGGLVAAGAVADGRSAARRSLVTCLPWLGLAGAGIPAGWTVTAVALALPLLVHAAWLIMGDHTRRLPFAALAIAGTGAAAGAGFLLLLRHLLLTRSVSGAGRSLHEVLLFSPLPADLLVRVNPSAGRAIYPGLVAVLLAGVGGAVWCRRPLTAAHRVLLVYPFLLVLAVVLSLGPRLTALPLFEAAFYLVPSWNFIRQPAKFQVVASLALAILGAAGVAALTTRSRSRRARMAVWIIIASLVAIEYHPWRPTGVSFLRSDGPAYGTIQAIGPRVLYIPLWPGDSSYSGVYLYATTLTRVPMLNGYSAWLDRSYLPDVYRRLESINLGAVGEAEYATLRQLGVHQIVLDRAAFPLKVSPFGPAFTLARLRASPYLDLVRDPADEGPLWVFRARPEPGAPGAPLPESPLGIHWEAESLNRDTGQVVEAPGASNGRVVEARAGRDQPGFLLFGPYRMLPAGEFDAVFWLRGQGADVEVQVTTSGGRQVRATAHALLAGSRVQEVPVRFVLEGPATVEYRVRWDGRGTAAADAVSVAFAGETDPAPGFAVTALGHELIERPDADASDGLAGYADPRRTPRALIWTGPLRRYPAGRYRLWVRLKVDQPTTAALAWCGAQAASRGPVLGGRELMGAELATSLRYTELAVPFTVAADAVLEFPCLYHGAAGVWFDRLRIERLAPE